MTPQETQLVNDLFDRLAKLESAPRDAAAERLISDGLRRAPHAVYALAQTALVQDEALKRAGARIEELEAQTANAELAEQRPASFLDSMRDAVTGRAAGRGSVPNVRPPAPATQPQNLQSEGSQSENFQPRGGQPPGGYPPPPPGYPGGAAPGAGGSFLGNAASTAAGVIGGSLLLNSIRSMFGQQAGAATSPWSKTVDSGAGKSDLARDLGADKVKDQSNEVDSDQPGDVESASDTDDGYDPDDNDDTGDDQDDFDGEDSDDDSYDV
jgi:uncharacterized protein